MSLEQLIAENTLVMRELIVVMRSSNDGAAAVGTPATDKPATRGKGKATDKPATDANVNDGTKVSVKLVDGDPEGTRYYQIEKHNSVARVLPGETTPSIEGIKEVSGDDYLALKARYAAMTQTVTDKKTDTAEGAVDFKTIHAAASELAGKEGGKLQLKAIFDELKIAKLPEIQAKPVADQAALLAKINAILKPAAPAGDDLGL